MRLLALAFALGVSSSASVMAADIDTPRRLVRVSPGFVEQDLVNARPVSRAYEPTAVEEALVGVEPACRIRYVQTLFGVQRIQDCPTVFAVDRN
jgi:hypothetical protein